jgi:hypothetical protein
VIDWLPVGLVYSHRAIPHAGRCLRCGRRVGDHAGRFRRWLWRGGRYL